MLRKEVPHLGSCSRSQNREPLCRSQTWATHVSHEQPFIWILIHGHCQGNVWPVLYGTISSHRWKRDLFGPRQDCNLCRSYSINGFYWCPTYRAKGQLGTLRWAQLWSLYPCICVPAIGNKFHVRLVYIIKCPYLEYSFIVTLQNPKYKTCPIMVGTPPKMCGNTCPGFLDSSLKIKIIGKYASIHVFIHLRKLSTQKLM